jgi:hypothetical protein
VIRPAPAADEDELSPENNNVRLSEKSAAKSARQARTVSPVIEEVNAAPDELSILDEAPTTQSSRSTDIVPVTPGMQPAARTAMFEAPRTELSQNTPAEQESEDELSPPNANTAIPRVVTNESIPPAASQGDGMDVDVDELSPSHINTATPRIVTRVSLPATTPQEDGLGVDELSPVQAPPTQPTPSAKAMQRKKASTAPSTTPQSTKLKTVAKATEDEPAAIATLPSRPKSSKRGRPPKSSKVAETEPTAVEAKRKSEKRKRDEPVHEEREEELVPEEEEADELSPKPAHSTKQPPKPPGRQREDVALSEEVSDAYEEESEPEETQQSRPKQAAKSPQLNSAQKTKPTSEKPPRKRQKFLGPKLSIAVMRMKGYGVRGVTVADTTRTLIEEALDGRLTKMMEKMQTIQDSARRKELRGDMNMSLSFKESLNEKLMDLQDANDVLTTNLKKVKLFKRDNAALRKEILSLQNHRQEVALEHDDVQADFEAEKARVEARNTLSANMFDIEAAIQNGRKKARKEGREDEGPELPLSMLLETVGRDVGSFGGGLLSRVRGFNGALERAAGWLEGKA